MIQYMRSGKLMAPVNKRKNGEKKIYNEDCLFGFGSKALEVVVLDLIGCAFDSVKLFAYSFLYFFRFCAENFVKLDCVRLQRPETFTFSKEKKKKMMQSFN